MPAVNGIPEEESLEPGALDPDERAELQRLRAEVAQYQRQRARRGSRLGRWVGALVLLVIGSVLAGLSVVAVYLRAEVLDTETYVQTVAPLAEDPTVRDALANRLADEIIIRTNVAELANELADRLVDEGAPERLPELVGPVISGLRSFLYNEIYKLLGTPQFQTIWEELNRTAHDALDAVLTGEEGRFVSSSGTTVTLNIGALLSAVKQELVARGFDIVSRVPDVSLSYTLIQSDKLPALRRYTTVLNTVATWLPFVALLVLGAGVLAAPNRRRGIVCATSAIAIVAAALLGALALGRAYYLSHLPAAIQSPDAMAVVIDTALRFLVAALQTLLIAALIGLAAAWLAGPSRPATVVRRAVNLGLDAGAKGLGHAGTWVVTTGRALHAARWAIQTALVLAAIVGLIVAQRPGISAVLWTTLVLILLLALVELFARAPSQVSG